MPVIVEGSTIRLYGNVLFDDGVSGSFNAADVARALSRIDANADIRIHINSAGGDAFEGITIHSLISSRSGKTHIVVEGLAASAGSLIAMAGKTVTMMPGALMMIHDCHTYSAGNAKELRRRADEVDLMSDAYAKVYADRTKKSAKACRDLMRAETWFSPETAVAQNFAERVGSGPIIQAMAFNYATYQNAPPQLLQLAKAHDWKPFPTFQQKEHPMTNETSEEKDRIKAIMRSAEAEGRGELAEHLAFDTEMPAEAAIAILAKAKAAAPAPAAQAMTLKDVLAALPYSERRQLAAAGAMATSGRMNAAGLAMSGLAGGHQDEAPASGLVDAMKRRHGVK